MAFAVAALLVACGASSKKSSSSGDAKSDETDWGDIKEQPPEEGPAVQCLRDGEPIECTSNEECCENFECGIDPEGSTRLKTCIWSGK